MRLEEVYDRWNRTLERIREKWIELTSGIVLVFAEEEMKLRREELDKHIETHNQLEESQGAVEG